MKSEVGKIHYEVTQTRNLLSHSLIFFFFLASPGGMWNLSFPDP